MHNVNRIEFTYDGFGRVTGRTYSNTSGATRRVTTYTYQDVGTDKTTTLLKSVNNSGFGELGYEYDAVGNITQITKNGTVQETYTYDALNQLKTVTHNGITTEYNYQNGNITSVTQNGTVIKTYGYTNSSWSDLLTSFNGQTITYDEIGNPLQYRDGLSFTWAKGRQLQSVTKDGLTASYTYDENGLRLSKTVNGVTTNIFRTNGQMVGMNSSDGKDMTFMLDGNGNVYGVHYDHYSSNQPKSETYYFAYNAQGDVIGIYEFSGRLMATYDYDEWGNCTVNMLAADNNGHAVDSPDHIAYANPFRYRGYFYDAETGFYYLNSRYYDPGTGRFVNADGIYDTDTGMLSHNMFAYCNNNPINMIDSEGTGPRWDNFKQKVIDIWDKFTSLFKDDPPEPNVDVMSKVNDAVDLINIPGDMRQDIYTHAENVVNKYSGTYTGKPKPYKNKKLNRTLTSQKVAYIKLICFQDISLENCFDFHIEGKEWNDFSDEEKQMIAENIKAWDPVATAKISQAYGFQVCEDVWGIANG